MQKKYIKNEGYDWLFKKKTVYILNSLRSALLKILKKIRWCGCERIFKESSYGKEKIHKNKISSCYGYYFIMEVV